ncbi:MAG: kelch repeat-containing protein [Myxococcota bacterium]
MTTSRFAPILALAAACAPAGSQWSITLVSASEEDPFASATDIQVSLCSNECNDCRPVESFQRADGSGTLGELGYDSYRVEVRLLDGQENIVGYGGSACYRFAGEDRQTTISVGKAGAFFTARKESGDDVALEFGLAGMSATSLEGGRVLLAGGAEIDSDGKLTSIHAEAFLYDPDTGGLDPAPSMSTPRAWHTATTLKRNASGVKRVLLAGGLTIGGNSVQATPTADVFDPGDETFQAADGAMREPRFGHAAAALLSSEVLLVGGGQVAAGAELPIALGDLSVTASRTADEFTPLGRSGQFGAVDGNMVEARMWPTATALGEDVAIIGGAGDDGSPAEDETVERYHAGPMVFCPGQNPEERPACPDPDAAGSFDVVENGGVRERYGHAAALLGAAGAEIVVAGGIGANGSAMTSVEIYTLETIPAPVGSRTLREPRAFPTMISIDADRFLVVGGHDSGVPQDTAEIWSPSTGESGGLINLAAGGRLWHAMAKLDNQMILIAGGATSPDGKGGWTGQTSIELYVPDGDALRSGD